MCIPYASAISTISQNSEKLLHFEASQHICRCPPSVILLFNPYPKGARVVKLLMILCALCASLPPKLSIWSLPKKRGFSICICGGARGWAVNFYSRIHFQYTHFSPPRPICKVLHFSNWLEPIQDSIVPMQWHDSTIFFKELRVWIKALQCLQHRVGPQVFSSLSSLLNQFLGHEFEKL